MPTAKASTAGTAALLALADEYGFGLRVCRPYRAKTKGKVERFNGYLKGSFLVPLAATLKSAGLKLDVAAANAHVGRWLSEVANARVHATTGERPDRRLALERSALLPLPSADAGHADAGADARPCPMPIESLQHPLSVYDALLEVRGMNLQHERIAALCTQLKLERIAARVAAARPAKRRAMKRASPISSSGCSRSRTRRAANGNGRRC